MDLFEVLPKGAAHCPERNGGVMKGPFSSIDVDSIEEWLAIWDALSQLIENSDQVEDPMQLRAAAAAERVVARMDQIFINHAAPEVFHVEGG